jgi:hypothetical protein
MKPRDKLGPALEAARSMAPRRALGGHQGARLEGEPVNPPSGGTKVARPEPVAVGEPVTAERIEHAMVVLAFIITSTGDTAYAPLLDRLERELAEYKQERDPMSRARRILQDHTVEGTGKAIR